MKLRLLSAIFALVVPLAACAPGNNSASSPSPSSSPNSISTNSDSSPTATSPDSTSSSDKDSSNSTSSADSLPNDKSSASKSSSSAKNSHDFISNNPDSSASAKSSKLASSDKASSKSRVDGSASKSSSSTTTAYNSINRNAYSYVATDGSYSVKFPGKPQEKKQTAQAPTGPVEISLTTYNEPIKQRAYLSASNNVPLKAGAKASDFNIEKGLDGARDGAAKNNKAKIVSETKISQHGLPGREIILLSQNNIATKLRVFIDPKKPKIYQALVVSGDGNTNFPEAQAFLDSFTIK